MQYKEILKEKNLQHIDNAELWRMRYACMSNLHPDTQLPINPLFRASGFIPVNIPLIAMLALLPPTVLLKKQTFCTLLGQSSNQFYNFCFNYANRNASNEFKTSQMVGIGL